ncbi:hypothetical protein C4577_05985 [Candidatus Parcubacteria bacterium]|nr:MAG: hypothetical protein C4577_05985 [Candidatus Parcubacteria bacterium]
MAFVKSYWSLILVLILSLGTILPLFHPGFFPIHDNTQIERVYEMNKSLSDGFFPVRWVEDLGYGYGYPIFNFYSPLPYYLGSMFIFLGLNALVATKAIFALGIILSGVFMYIFIKQIFGELPGLISAIIYLYFPYHAINIYVRGDLDEIFAYAFLPLVFLGIFKTFLIFKEKPQTNSGLKWLIILAVSVALVIISHNLTSFMLLIILMPLVLVLFGVSNFNLKLISYYFIALFVGFLLSSFYSIPALLEMNYTNVTSQIGGGASFSDHFVCLDQFWNSAWGYGGSTKSCLDGMSFKIGKLNIAIAFLSLLILFTIRLKNKMKLEKKDYIYLLSIVFFFISLIMSTSYSSFVWNLVPNMSFIQYPWRFLNFAGLFISIAAGFMVLKTETLIGKKIHLLIVSLIVILTIGYNLKLFNPQSYYLSPSDYYTNQNHIKWETSKISDEYMPRDFFKPKNQTEIVQKRFEFDQEVKINSILDNTQNIALDFEALKPTRLYINIAHFPGWKITSDEKEEAMITNKGYILNVSPGHRLVNIRFEGTKVQKTANMLTIIGILIVVIGIINIRQKRISRGS